MADPIKMQKENDTKSSSEFASTKESKGANIIPWFLDKFGIFFSYLILPFPVFFYFLAGGARRDAVIDFYNTLFPNRPLLNVLRAFSNYYYFGMGVVDRLALGTERPLNVDYSKINKEVFLPAGSILIGAHFGDWFCTAIALSKRYDVKISLVIDLRQTPKFRDLIKSIGGSDVRFIDSSVPKLDFALTIKQEIEAGRCVSFMGDRHYAGQKSIREEFFGRYTEFPIAPYKLAHVLKCPIYCFFSLKSGRKPNDRFLIFHEELYDGKEKVKVGEIAQRYIRTLEGLVAKYPQQWFNFYDYWNSKPPTDSG